MQYSSGCSNWGLQGLMAAICIALSMTSMPTVMVRKIRKNVEGISPLMATAPSMGQTAKHGPTDSAVGQGTGQLSHKCVTKMGAKALTYKEGIMQGAAQVAAEAVVAIQPTHPARFSRATQGLDACRAGTSSCHA